MSRSPRLTRHARIGGTHTDGVTRDDDEYVVRPIQLRLFMLGDRLSERLPDALSVHRAAIARSLQQVVPAGVTLTVDGRRLIFETKDTRDVGVDVLCGPLFVVNRRAALWLVAKSMMDDTWHFVHDYTGETWPAGLTRQEPRCKVSISNRILYMVYTENDGETLLACPPVDLDPEHH